jgi:hypothetical protein
MAEYLASIFGTEKDKVGYSFPLLYEFYMIVHKEIFQPSIRSKRRQIYTFHRQKLNEGENSVSILPVLANGAQN